ncbi:hypothetical protein [Paraburkholderia antibiotica]|uniref:hypothetical protein n=1 Tax=Paraburkholderia antibiotica TaxID=2728839 RepID=UPI001E2EC76B|nr:hypothetical protein [Paraburkholderia antibiotica]
MSAFDFHPESTLFCDVDKSLGFDNCTAFIREPNTGPTGLPTKSTGTTDDEKLLLLVSAVIAFTLGLVGAQPAAAAADTPEATVKAFYTWYIQKEDARDAHYFQLTDNAIYSYVSRKTVDVLRDDYRHNRLPGDIDYFTRGQDLDRIEATRQTKPRGVRREGKRALAANQGGGCP